MSRDQYRYGPEHSFSIAGHYIGGISFGRKIKNHPAAQAARHGKPMHIAWLVIGCMLGADMLGATFANGAEIAWAVLAALVVTVVTVAMAVRKHRAKAIASTALAVPGSASRAIADETVQALEQKLADTQSVLADVLVRAQAHERRR